MTRGAFAAVLLGLAMWTTASADSAPHGWPRMIVGLVIGVLVYFAVRLIIIEAAVVALRELGKQVSND